MWADRGTCWTASWWHWDCEKQTHYYKASLSLWVSLRGVSCTLFHHSSQQCPPHSSPTNCNRCPAPMIITNNDHDMREYMLFLKDFSGGRVTHLSYSSVNKVCGSTESFLEFKEPDGSDPLGVCIHNVTLLSRLLWILHLWWLLSPPLFILGSYSFSLWHGVYCFHSTES